MLNAVGVNWIFGNWLDGVFRFLNDKSNLGDVARLKSNLETVLKQQ